MSETLPIDQVGRPIQILPYSQKDKEWFKKNINYYIMRSNFNFGAQTNGRKDIRVFYEVYNNQFPLEWFSHITNPLGSTKAEYKNFPAKVRPVTILRQNIDLLLGEYKRRPFIYNVENYGENGYNRFTDAMKTAIHDNLSQFFIKQALQTAQDGGQKLNPQQLQALQQNPPFPDEVAEQLKASYKDAIAIKGQKWLRRVIREKDVKKKLHRCFKDWLIAGQCYTYKGVINDDLEYRQVYPMNIDYDKSQENPFIEDGEWVVERRMCALSDVVDTFYEQLSQEDQEDLETHYYYNTPMGFYDHLRGLYTDPNERNKCPVFHVQWKGRKKIGFLSYFDEETMQIAEEIVDEDYKVDRAAGEQVEWRCVNEVYEGWRIGDKIYTRLGPVKVQRNEMNNHSACKLSYNGRKFSDQHAENISVLEMGLPFQIMYIIVTYTLEKTIAKSKGKIIMFDQATIPNEDGWDEEKFFYYADALGYALLNRNQIGVDKTWNQYQVLDMGLFDQIKQLIELQDYFKKQWDECIGITRQRKGETYASDGQGVTERAVFQSTVITDMIFINFDEFVEKELQGIMDYAKPLTSNGVKGIYNDDEFGTELMHIDPMDFENESLGVFVDGNEDNMRKLRNAEQMAQAMLQNKARPSTVLEVLDAVNFADLKAKLKRIEDIEDQIAQQQQQDEQQAQADADDRKQKMMAYEKLLERQNSHAEYLDKMDLEELVQNIKGQYMVESMQADKSDAGADIAQAIQLEQSREHNKNERSRTQAMLENFRNQHRQKQQELDLQRKTLEHQMHKDKADHGIKKEKLKIDRKKASRPSSA
jgi:hypothetical protein